MPTTTQTTHRPDENAVPSTSPKDLGLAILIVESADGAYQPLGTVSSIQEAQEIAKADRISRVEALELGAEPLCPERYVVWARGANGAYLPAHEIDAHAN
jgi:hypothetical protein